MPPSRNNTVKFTDLQAISSVNPGDIIPVVDTSVPTLVNKKINVQDFSRSLPVSQQMTQVGVTSANWNSTYTTTLANSASWSTGGSYGSVYSANSAEYESAYTSLNANSANWDSAYTTVKESSAAWVGLTTYTTVNSLSNNWDSGFSSYTTLNNLSSNYWLLKSGDQLTGALTTTKTLTSQFTNLDEFITKRYADSLATATQISGNFVPSLYYTKNDFTTGIAGLQVNAPTLATNSHFRVVSADGKTLFNVSSAGRVAIRGRSTAVIENDMLSPTRDLELVGFTQPILFRHYGSNTGFIVDEFGHGLNSDVAGCWLGASGTGARVQLWGGGPLNGVAIGSGTTGFLNTYNNGKVVIGRSSIYAQALTLTAPLCAHVSVVTDSAMNSFTSDMLVLSAGPGTTSTMNFVRGFITSDGTSTLQVRRDGFTTLGVGGLGRIFLYEGPNLGIDADPTNPTGNLGLASYMGLGWSSTIAANGTKDTTWFRSSPGVIEQRASTTPQIYRLYNTYSDANNYERLSLSATRIAYEAAGTGVSRDLTIITPGNLILSGASVQINSQLPFYYASLSASKLTFDRGPAPISNPHISVPAWDNNYWISDNTYNSIWGGSGPSLNFNTQYNNWYMGIASRVNGVNNTYNLNLHRDLAICWSPSTSWNETGDLFLFRDEPYTLAIRDRLPQTRTNVLRIYNNYVNNTTNFERFGLSGNRIAYELSGSQRFFIASTPTNVNGIIGFSNNIGGFNTLDAYNGADFQFARNGSSTHMLRCFSTGGQYEIIGNPAMYTGNNAAAQGHGFTFADTGGFARIGIFPDTINGLGIMGNAGEMALRIYKSFTNFNNYERLSLSATRIAYEFAGTGVSRDLTIQSTGNIILSAGGVINLSQSLPTSFNNLSAQILTVGPSDAAIGGSFGVLRVPTSPGATGYPGIIAYATNASNIPTFGDTRISIVTYGGMGYQNTSSIWAPSIVTRRIVANPFSHALTPSNFDDETDIALKINGRLGFSYGNDISSTSARLSATMGYDLSTSLISLSSRTRVQGFTFTGKSAENGKCVIYSDISDNLNLAAYSGAGKSIRFCDWDYSNGLAGGLLGAVSYSGWQMINMNLTNFPGYLTTDTLRVNQLPNQTGSYLKVINSSSSTIFEINSANNVVVRNLLALGGTTSGNAAIKASGSSVVAKLGDDSDYAFLQGKLQTLNTAAAGTFTPDKYIILYDSTGTAYKVPVQAL